MMIFALFLFFSLFSPKTFCISYCMYNFCFQILYNGILFHLIIQQIFMQNLLCQTLNCLLGTDLILIAFTEHAFIFYIYSKYAMYNYSKTHFHLNTDINMWGSFFNCSVMEITSNSFLVTLTIHYQIKKYIL